MLYITLYINVAKLTRQTYDEQHKWSSGLSPDTSIKYHNIPTWTFKAPDITVKGPQVPFQTCFGLEGALTQLTRVLAGTDVSVTHMAGELVFHLEGFTTDLTYQTFLG